MQQTRKHGGVRPASGRKTLFSGKFGAPVSVSLTREGRASLKAAAVRLGISSSDVVESLIRQFGGQLSVAPPRHLTPKPVKQEHSARRSVEVNFLRGRSADSVRHLLRNFAERYKADWAGWHVFASNKDLTTPAVVAEFKRILGGWQAVRPRPLARTEALTELLTSLGPDLAAIDSIDLRNIRTANQQQIAALVALWDQIRSRLAIGGHAGCVGVTKAIMLLTHGRIGPALDSRVRKSLGLRGPIESGQTWITALRAISEDLAEFESQTGTTLEELVEVRWRPIAVGRAYDMAAGPRPD